MTAKSSAGHSCAMEILAADYRLLTRSQEQTLKMEKLAQKEPIRCMGHLQVAFYTIGSWN